MVKQFEMVASAVLLAPSLLRFLLVENCGGCRVPEAVNSGDCSLGDKVTAAKRVKYALTVFVNTPLLYFHYSELKYSNL